MADDQSEYRQITHGGSFLSKCGARRCGRCGAGGADLVLLDANPLEDINNIRKIRAVVTNGRMFDRNQLDAMLADIQKSASQWAGIPTR